MFAISVLVDDLECLWEADSPDMENMINSIKMILGEEPEESVEVEYEETETSSSRRRGSCEQG